MEVKECIFNISYRFLSHTQSKKPCFISNHFIMKKYFKTVIIDPKNTPIGLNEKNISVAVSESLRFGPNVQYWMCSTACRSVHLAYTRCRPFDTKCTLLHTRCNQYHMRCRPMVNIFGQLVFKCGALLTKYGSYQ